MAIKLALHPIPGVFGSRSTKSSPSGGAAWMR